MLVVLDSSAQFTTSRGMPWKFGGKDNSKENDTHVGFSAPSNFFMDTKLEKYQKLASFSHRLFIKIHDFFGIVFRIDLFIDF